MWKKQGSWNFFHAKLIPNSSMNYELTEDCELIKGYELKKKPPK